MALPINSNLHPVSPKNDQKYLDGILNNDFAILNNIYKKFLPSIQRFVIANNGSTDHALDVFQDGLIVIYKKLKNGELELTSNFHSYLFAVCRFIWLRELEKKHRQNSSIDEMQPFISDIDIDIEETLFRFEKQQFFRSKLEELPIDAQRVLTLYFRKTPMKTIAAEMGYTVEYAKKKKYKAQMALIELVKKDRRFEELF